MKYWKIGVVFLAVVAAFIVPSLNLKPYYLHLLSLSLIWVIMTQGLNVIQGYTGYVSIAQASFFGIGTYTSALLTTKADFSFWLALPLSVIAAAIAGIIVGYPALRTKGHYFAIVTMAFCMIIWTLMVTWSGFTGGEAGIPNVNAPESFFGLNFAKKTNYYYLILVFALLSIGFVYRLVHSKIGRALVTIRENEQLAQAVGISLMKYKMLAFVISAALGGLSGSLYAHYIRFVNPSPFTTDYSMNAILAVILGGSGTIVGPIIGSFMMVFLPEYLRLADEYRFVIYGVMLILIMIYLPKGIIHALQLAGGSLVHAVNKYVYKKRPEKDPLRRKV